MNHQSFFLTLITTASIFGLSSCTSTITTLYGLKNIKPVDERTIMLYSDKYGIPVEDNYELATTYKLHLKSLDASQYKAQKKNHSQPLQALYYDKTGNLLSFHVNCYTGGFPNLLWNRDGIMATFPPKQQAPLDSIVSLDTQIEYLKPLSKTGHLSTDAFDYIIIVYWSRFMGRQSKRLIRTVQKNSNLSSDELVKIIYANTDNLFAGK